MVAIYTRGLRYCAKCEKITKEFVCSVCHKRTRTKPAHSQTAKKRREEQVARI